MNTETKHTHTQGPWRVIEHGKGREKHCVGTSNTAPLQAVICEINTKSVGTNDAIRLANARLIASAPELLAALILAVPLMQRYAMRSAALEPSVDRILPAMISAIDKAEGNA